MWILYRKFKNEKFFCLFFVFFSNFPIKNKNENKKWYKNNNSKYQNFSHRKTYVIEKNSFFLNDLNQFWVDILHEKNAHENSEKNSKNWEKKWLSNRENIWFIWFQDKKWNNLKIIFPLTKISKKQKTEKNDKHSCKKTSNSS